MRVSHARASCYFPYVYVHVSVHVTLHTHVYNAGCLALSVYVYMRVHVRVRACMQLYSNLHSWCSCVSHSPDNSLYKCSIEQFDPVQSQYTQSSLYMRHTASSYVHGPGRCIQVFHNGCSSTWLPHTHINRINIRQHTHRRSTDR